MQNDYKIILKNKNKKWRSNGYSTSNAIIYKQQLDITQSHFDKGPVFNAVNQFIRPCIKCGFYGMSQQSILNQVNPDNTEFVCESYQNKSDSQ